MPRWLLRLLLVCGSLAFGLIAAEITLRWLGYQRWFYARVDKNEPTMHEYDPLVGWKSKAERFRIPPYHAAGSEIRFTFLAGGIRKTSDSQTSDRDDRPKLLVLGGSYTQGWAISDEETYAWKVQKALPSLEVVNYGTAGYGTFQSLLVLEQALESLRQPKIVVYGFIEQHEVRNVAPAKWMEVLTRYSRRGTVYVPYATIDHQLQLSRHPPEAYPSWPLREQSVLVTLAANMWISWQTEERKTQARDVTERLFVELRDTSAAHDAELVVALLEAKPDRKKHYTDFCTTHNIRVVDCIHPLTSELRVKGEGHPNGKMNSLWTQCILDYLIHVGLATDDDRSNDQDLPSEEDID